jgi:hypothetical protein
VCQDAWVRAILTEAPEGVKDEREPKFNLPQDFRENYRIFVPLRVRYDEASLQGKRVVRRI